MSTRPMLDLHAGNTLEEQVEADLAAGAAGRAVPAALEGPGVAALALEAPSAAGGPPVCRAIPWGACVGAGLPVSTRHFMKAPGWPVWKPQGPACTASAQARRSWSAGTAVPSPTSQSIHEDVQIEAVLVTPEAAPGQVAVCGPRSSRSQTPSTCFHRLCHA